MANFPQLDLDRDVRDCGGDSGRSVPWSGPLPATEGTFGDGDAARKRDHELHRLLVGGDRTAFAKIVELHLEPAYAVLRHRFPPPVDEHLILECLNDSLLGLLNSSPRYEPHRSDLRSFLVMDAAGDVKNRLKTVRRRAAKKSVQAVELLPDLRNDSAVGDRMTYAGADSLHDRLAMVFPDPSDLAAVSLILEGVRSTARFAELFGVAALPADEQRRLVKRHKDRIRQRLRRHGREIL